MKLYSSYILNEKFLLSEKEKLNRKYYYEVKQIDALSIYVAVRVLNGSADWVIYYNTEDEQNIKEYHRFTFGEMKYSIYKELSINSYSLKDFNNYELIRICINQINNDHLVKTEAVFSSHYHLVEFRENFYDGTNLTHENIFVPNAWEIIRE